jgi:hydroxymethylbilane synthase
MDNDVLIEKPKHVYRAITDPSSTRLIIGSRGSKLALFQANWAKAQLEKNHGGLEVVIEIIKTSGDVFLDAPLSRIGGKGLFTKEIEDALLERRIDVAVHSLKDLPTVLPEGLCLAAVSQREDSRDAFLSNRYPSVSKLSPGARVGTSSLRRQSQLLQLREGLQILNLRGNIDTRIRKLEAGEYDAILLACAGLDRLGFGERIRERICIEQICPAVGQGALGIETRVDDVRTRQHVACLHHPATALAVRAERALLRELGGGCQVPIAGHAWIEHNDYVLRMIGVVASADGKRVVRERASGPVEDPELLGTALAKTLLAAGARTIVESFQPT